MGKFFLQKKAAKIGAGCWNGYGGGVESNETIESSAIRELEEESGIKGKEESLEKIAVVDFHNTKSDGKEFVCQVHFFTLTDWEGTAVETKEMLTPTWFDIHNLPLSEMMPGDRLFVPQALQGEKLHVKVHYGAFQKQLLKPVEIKPLID
jgi:8-oxo-dGTP pyrophosphatase MutT (NUDIX family)